jgi:hypothetical protein
VEQLVAQGGLLFLFGVKERNSLGGLNGQASRGGFRYSLDDPAQEAGDQPSASALVLMPASKRRSAQAGRRARLPRIVQTSPFALPPLPVSYLGP